MQSRGEQLVGMYRGAVVDIPHLLLALGAHANKTLLARQDILSNLLPVIFPVRTAIAVQVVETTLELFNMQAG
jgi:hypothetical protein